MKLISLFAKNKLVLLSLEVSFVHLASNMEHFEVFLFGIGHAALFIVFDPLGVILAWETGLLAPSAMAVVSSSLINYRTAEVSVRKFKIYNHSQINFGRTKFLKPHFRAIQPDGDWFEPNSTNCSNLINSQRIRVLNTPDQPPKNISVWDRRARCWNFPRFLIKTVRYFR